MLTEHKLLMNIKSQLESITAHHQPLNEDFGTVGTWLELLLKTVRFLNFKSDFQTETKILL